MIESAKIVIDDNSVTAKDCAICDEPFEIRDMYDNRIICQRCKKFLKTIINLNMGKIEPEDQKHEVLRLQVEIYRMGLCRPTIENSL